MSTGKNAWTYSAHHALEKLMDVHQTCIKNKHTAYRAYAVWDLKKKKKDCGVLLEVPTNILVLKKL